MDEFIGVRFHYGGMFAREGTKLHYHGGKTGISFIDKDKISLPEIKGYLQDHTDISKAAMIYWHVPGKELADGLITLVDDQSCLQMSEFLDEIEVAEIYVEEILPEVDDKADGDVDYEVNVDEAEEIESSESSESSEIEEVIPIIRTKTTVRRNVVAEYESVTANNVVADEEEVSVRAIERISNEEEERRKGKEKVGTDGEGNREAKEKGSGDDDDDSDYAGDDDSSEVDEEVQEIRKKYKELKKKIRNGVPANLDDVILDQPIQEGDHSICIPDEDGGYDTPYASSCSDESLEMDSDGELHTTGFNYPRYNKSDPTQVLCIGMKFVSKKQFMKAIVKYALAERRQVRFIRNEKKRCRVKCDWESCPWVCLASTNSRTSSWQIATLSEGHTCPPRTDNKWLMLGG